MIDRYVAASLRPLGWPGIIRLGMVQAALGSVVVLVISTLNRVMVVEYARPAVLPGALVALHYAVQLSRPRFGYGSDRGGRRHAVDPRRHGRRSSPAACCARSRPSDCRVSAGRRCCWRSSLTSSWVLGVGAAGTSLLVLHGRARDERRRARGRDHHVGADDRGLRSDFRRSVGRFLDPFSPRRLIW